MLQTPGPLSGYRFLIVENEIAQAIHLGEMVSEMGGTVSATAYGYDQARDAVDRASFDCAILDINLSGTLSFPIADALRARGIPFVICTAYAEAASVYPGMSETQRLDKPIEAVDLRDALLRVLDPSALRKRW